MMWKKVAALLLTLCVFLLLDIPGVAIEGSCGDSAAYSLNEATGVLMISGTGPMKDGAFLGTAAQKVKTAYVAQGITHIGGAAFANCLYLTAVSIPDSVTSVGNSAFMNCKKLTDIYYGGSTAQWNAITVGDLNNSYFTNASVHCESFQEPPAEPTPAPSTAYLEYEKKADHVVITGCDRNAEGIIIIPDEIEGLPVTELAYYAFGSCEHILKIIIPASVTAIHPEGAIVVCPNLLAIEVDEDNPNYCSEDGILFNKDKTTLIRYPSAKSGFFYSIPNGVTKLADRAFCECKGLMSIEIPDTVSVIDPRVFLECDNLTSITIPNGVPTIGDNAFWHCIHMTSVTIPVSVTLIDNSAFSDCIRLSDVYYGGTEAD